MKLIEFCPICTEPLLDDDTYRVRDGDEFVFLTRCCDAEITRYPLSDS